MTRPNANHTSQAAKRAPSPSGVDGARIRERRRELHLSLQALAGRTDLTSSFLSLIERNINRPSLESLRRIAEALEVPLFYFAETNGENPVVRRNERVQITFPPGSLRCELLVPNLRHRLEIFIAHTHPSAGNIARAPKHDSEECIYVMQGRLRVRLQDAEYVLNRGDSVYFHGSTLQEICAQGRRQATFLSVITPPVL
jgi:transcriptional regulator with XRE-family HTH domain